jgi:hypothetical protein
MNDENKNNLSAKKSLCYTCKHGLCIAQQMHAQVLGEITEQEVESEDLLDIPWDDGTEPASEIPHGMQHLQMDRVCSLCYYNPPGRTDPPTINAAVITDCNRYERDDSIQ